MIYEKSDKALLFGIDEVIHSFQTRFETYFMTNITDKHIYGKIEKHTDSNGYVLPDWLNSNGKYIDVFNDNKKSLVIGFYVKDSRKILNKVVAECDVDIIFTCNLNKVFVDEIPRSDEKFIVRVIQFLKNYNFIYEGVNTGVAEVFKDFDRDKIMYNDLHPYFVMSVSGKMRYQFNKC
jgi:hypothetical protein